MIASKPIDLVILDVNLRGERSYGFADDLRNLGIPFLLSTGYEREDIDVRFVDAPILSKPFAATSLLQAIRPLTAIKPPLRPQDARA